VDSFLFSFLNIIHNCTEKKSQNRLNLINSMIKLYLYDYLGLLILINITDIIIVIIQYVFFHPTHLILTFYSTYIYFEEIL